MFQFSLTFRNNTTANMRASMLALGMIRGEYNSPKTFTSSLAGANFNVTEASVYVRNNGVSDYTRYTAPVLVKTIQGVCDALNNLNVGLFWVSGTSIVTANSVYSYQKIYLGPIAPIVWSTFNMQQYSQSGITRHIVDRIVSEDGEVLTVDVIDLPSFCSYTTTNVTGLNGGRTCVVIDIIVSPTAGMEGQYNFTLRAVDPTGRQGLKAVNLLVGTDPQQYYTTRNPLNANVSKAAIFSPIGPLFTNLTISGFGQNQYPAGGNWASGIQSLPGDMNPQILTNGGTVLGKYVFLYQTRDGSAGNRYMDATWWILQINA